MKIAIFVVACMVAVIAARPNEDKYSNKFDNIDLDKILSNDRLLNSYFKCLMEEGNCTAEGTTLKNILPDALATECAKCNEKQRAGAKKMIAYVVKNKPEMWKKLMDKYDPTKEYRVKFESEAKKEGIEINA